MATSRYRCRRDELGSSMMINDRRDPDGPTRASTAMEATGASPHDRGAVEKTVAARNILESATATLHDRPERARRRRHLIPGEIEQKGLQGKDRLRTAMAPLRYVPSAQRERVFERTDYCLRVLLWRRPPLRAEARSGENEELHPGPGES